MKLQGSITCSLVRKKRYHCANTPSLLKNDLLRIEVRFNKYVKTLQRIVIAGEPELLCWELQHSLSGFLNKQRQHIVQGMLSLSCDFFGDFDLVNHQALHQIF